MIESLAIGLSATLGFSGPAEWAVHKYILHSQTRPNSFIDSASIAHNDNHHGAYRAPHHYYRDLTNEHVLVHFSKSDVAVIASGGLVFGGTIGAISPLSAIGTAIGSAAATMISYGLYEFTHHYMHVIGERRLQIGRIFGDLAENGNRTGKLRLPKPTLDELCSTVDERLEGKNKPFIYQDNCEERLSEYGISTPVDELLDQTVQEMRTWEKQYLAKVEPAEAKKYKTEQKMNRLLRNNTLFRKLDNHHFLHHRKFNKNLNVVWTWWDSLIGTKEDSSIETLLNNKIYWLCPNSPDEEPFKLKG